MTAPLAYQTAGLSGSPPLVLLHSIASSSALWALQMPVWSQHFHVVAFDLPGHGESKPLHGEPSIERLADAVTQSCDALGLRRARFVGLSLGSMIVQRIAALQPGRVVAAVLSNGIFATPPAGARAWRERSDAARAHGMASQAPDTIARWFTPAFAQEAPLTMAWIEGLIRATSVDGYCFAADAIAAMDNGDLVAQIACPTLVLAGEHDHVAAPPAALRTLAVTIPGAQFATLPTSHLANVEMPARYTELVGKFLLEHAA